MSFKVLFLSYEENMISDEEFLLLNDEYSSKNPEFEPLVSTCLDMRRGCHAAKILPVCVRGTKNVCLVLKSPIISLNGLLWYTSSWYTL